ncbi:hypothetical protein BJF85_08575 [Saccharomonospora sp. CUA-673]|nr:hypothetical protein BJF85_08575 [Saccharomonospora sp. CUA-673]
MIDRPEPAVMVYLHMPIDTALSISETGAEIDGIGPIPGPLAREIMTNPRSIWRKVICDPATGSPVDLGRSSYRPNATIRKLVQVRDRMCVVPWCRRPARHCDIDHQQEWVKDQGPTSIDNAGPRCRKHHLMKNAPGWINHYDPVHGTSSVTTPFGVTYDGKREPVLNPKSSNPGETPDSPTGDASGTPPDEDPPPF